LFLSCHLKLLETVFKYIKEISSAEDFPDVPSAKPSKGRNSPDNSSSTSPLTRLGAAGKDTRTGDRGLESLCVSSRWCVFFFFISFFIFVLIIFISVIDYFYRDYDDSHTPPPPMDDEP
jgi:hypothetical protein